MLVTGTASASATVNLPSNQAVHVRSQGADQCFVLDSSGNTTTLQVDSQDYLTLTTTQVCLKDPVGDAPPEHLSAHTALSRVQSGSAIYSYPLATPELDSLMLFGTGLLGTAGYFVQRRRAAKGDTRAPDQTKVA